jgi:hypothetical protein
VIVTVEVGFPMDAVSVPDQADGFSERVFLTSINDTGNAGTGTELAEPDG